MNSRTADPASLAVPPGSFDLTAAADDALRAAAQAPPRAGDAAHPGFAFVMALGGMGWRIGEVCGALGLDFASGPVLVSCRIGWLAPLRTGARYHIAARVEGIERRASRSFGAADHLTLRIAVGKAAEVALRIVFRVPGAVGVPGGAAPPVEGPVLRRLDPVDAGAMRVWCAMMRDDNAIHTDRAAAARAGFGPRCVNPGPANLAYVLDALAAGGRRLAAVEARFLGTVFEGDRLAVVAVPGGAALVNAAGAAAVTVAATFAEGGA